MQIEEPKRILVKRREFLLVFGFVGASLLALSFGFPLVWDEGYTLTRIDTLRRWLVDNQSWSERLAAETLQKSWRFSKEEPDGHGPFYAFLSWTGCALTSRFLPPPVCYRIGTIVLFSLAAAAVYRLLAVRLEKGAAILTVVLLAFMPRIVPEVCFALIDGPLLSLALLAFCGFSLAVFENRLGGSILFGVAMGAAMANKLTGWFLPAPYLVYSILAVVFQPSRAERDQTLRLLVRTWLIGLPLAAATVLLLNVGWWPNLIDGMTRFFQSNLTRSQTIPIKTLFLGKLYPFALPWYNTIVWLIFAVPIGTVLLAFVGTIMAAAARDRFGLLLVLNWSLLMVLRAMPQAPGHDGTRQILIALGFTALLAGYGWSAISRRTRSRGTRLLAMAVGGLAALESIASTLAYHPHELSYYSIVVGGLPGAARLGMEPTYFFDSLTPDVMAWLEEHTGPDEWVLFCNYPVDSFQQLTRWGKLRFHWEPMPGRKPPKWYLLQHRPGIYKPGDRWLLANAQPVWQKTLFGTPLVSIYAGVDFQAAMTSQLENP